MNPNLKRRLTLHARRAGCVALLLLVAAATDVHAQLKGIAPGVVPGVGAISTPGVGKLPDLSVPGSPLGGVAELPSVPNNSVTLGLTFPGSLGVTVPSVPAPAPLDSIERAGSSITNSLANPRGLLGERNNPPANGSPAKASGLPAAGERRFIADEVTISLPSHLTRQALEALALRHRLTPIESHQIGLTGTSMHRLRISDGRSVPDVIRAIEREGGSTAVQPNYRFTLQEDESTSAADLQGMQYSLQKLHLAQAHRLATGEKVLVAVIDSGIDGSHPEIAGQLAQHFDAVPSDGSADGHGTAMAGAIIAHAHLKGVAPAARLLAVRAFGASGDASDGTTVGIVRGIDWAVAHGARIINMSFAGPNDPALARMLAMAAQKGVVLVAAAGNLGPKSPPLYPAADPNVIAVTATDASDKLLSVAARGRHIALAAPGVDVLCPAPGGGYQMSTGTSVAAAQVSGIAALLLQRKRDIAREDVRKALMESAIDLGPKGRDDQFGAGLADAYRALKALSVPIARSKPENVSAAR